MIEKKTCSLCKEEQLIEEFRKDKTRKDGYHPYCKSCQKRIRREAYNNNPVAREGDRRRHQTYYYESIGKDTMLEYGQSGKGREQQKKYRESEAGKIAEAKGRKQWYLSGKGARYHKEQYDNNPQFKLRHNLSARMRDVIRRHGGSKTASILKILGAPIEEVRTHIESRFQSGMTWGNYGEWHIDHTIPCDYFNLVDIEEQKICFHYLNLQPLWASENQKKNNSLPENFEELLALIKSKTEKYDYQEVI